MKSIQIKSYNLKYVKSNDKILFNTFNHFIEQDREKPDDYIEKVDNGNTNTWIDKFHKNNYHKITLDSDDLRWMYKAYELYHTIGHFSHLYDDDLEYTFIKYQDAVPKGKWFIRTDLVSLKYGKYGIGPYNNIKDIIISIVTTCIGHECFRKNDEICNIYFMKWKNIEHYKEFRIFVYQNEITAISAQHLYSINTWLSSLCDRQIKNVVYKILAYFSEHIRDKMAYMEGEYIIDLALIGENEEPYFIEVNPFGKDYASGSALFHWIHDHETLHDSNSVEFRYTKKC